MFLTCILWMNIIYNYICLYTSYTCKIPQSSGTRASLRILHLGSENSQAQQPCHAFFRDRTPERFSSVNSAFARLWGSVQLKKPLCANHMQPLFVDNNNFKQGAKQWQAGSQIWHHSASHNHTYIYIYIYLIIIDYIIMIKNDVMISKTFTSSL